MLNYILSATDDYSVSFRQILRDGNQVRRSFNFSFTTDSFPSAMDAIQKLQENPFRCLLGNLTFIESSNRDGGASIQVSGEATFYETLVGGQADGGLPPDKAGN